MHNYNTRSQNYKKIVDYNERKRKADLKDSFNEWKSKWRNRAARASGATLGFIGGSAAGGYVGYKAADAAEQYFNPVNKTQVNMPMLKRKRMGRITRRTTKKRKYVKKRSYRKRRSTRKSYPKQYFPGVKVGSANRVRINKRPIAKLSQRFKKAVQIAVENKGPIGIMNMVHGGIGLDSASFAALDNTQLVSAGSLWPTVLPSTTKLSEWDFTVDQFVNAASMMFNGALYSTTITNGVPEYLSPLITNRFPEKNGKYDIKNSWIKYEMANNMLRTVNVKVYEVKSKKTRSYVMGNKAATKVWTISGTPPVYSQVTNSLGVQDPIQEWANAATDDATLSSRSIATNYSAVPINYLYNSPMQSPSFKSQFDAQVIREIKLEPGQDYNFYVQGPSNFQIDLEKCFHDTFYYNIQKYSRAIMFVCYLDLVSGAVTGFGRLGKTNPNLSGFACEKTLHYEMYAPGQTSESNLKSVKLENQYFEVHSGASIDATDEVISSV